MYNVPARAEVVQKDVDAASIGWPLAKIRHLFGRIGQFLNLTTWYVMKNRSGVVQTVRELKNASPGPASRRQSFFINFTPRKLSAWMVQAA